jgi:tRNA (adenine57-N1/adenine58-N1)-methyltransferase catalytic subunit
MALGEAEKVAIIGAGTMGRQIALQLAAYGVEVALYDPVAEVLSQARRYMESTLPELIEAELLRAGAEVTGYELRPDFAARAQRNVATFLGDDAVGRYAVEVRDVYEGIDVTDLDRVVLDLPEPWRVVSGAAGALRRGGLLVAYTPQITQAMRLQAVLGDHGFDLADTVEVLNRSWHIEGQAVRPNHRMVAHTGFLTSARLLG